MVARKRKCYTLLLIFSLLLLFSGFAQAATDINTDQTTTVYAAGGDEVILHGISINVTAGYGLCADGTGTTVSGSVDVRSNALARHAVYANNNAVIVLEHANISATGNGSGGVYADNGAKVAITGNIESTWTDARNIAVAANRGSSVTVSGTVTSQATSVLASGNSTITVSDDSVIKSTGDIVIQADGTGSAVYVGNRVYISGGGNNAGLYSGNGGAIYASDDIRITGATGAAANGGTTNVGNDLSVDAIYRGLRTIGANSVVRVGDDASIKAGIGYGTGHTAYGIDASGSNSAVLVGDRLTLEVAANSNCAAILANKAGKVYISEDAKITAHTARGIESTNTGSEVHIGNRLKLYAVDGSKHAIFAANGGRVYISDDAEISADYTGLHSQNNSSSVRVGDGVVVNAARYGIYAIDGASIGVGQKLDLNTAYAGVCASGSSSGTASKIMISDGATIKASAFGIYATNNGEIAAGKGLDLTVSMDNASGVAAWYGGRVALYGGKVTMKDAGAPAIYAAGSADILSDTAAITGRGVFDITGNMYADELSSIDMTMENGSRFTGATGYISSDASSALNLTLNGANTEWRVTWDSELKNLYMNGAMADMTYAGLGSELLVSNLGGSAGDSGVFRMEANIAGEIADHIRVGGTALGTYRIDVVNDGSQAARGTEITDLVFVNPNQSAAFALDHTVELGGFQYELHRPDADAPGETPPLDPGGIHSATAWYLRGAGRASNTGSGAVNSFAGSYLMAYADTQTLIQRMGDLRESPYGQGLWFRVHGGKFESNSKSYVRGFDMDYGGVQIGYDRKIENKWDGTLYAGIMFGYSKGDLDYSHEGSGGVDSKTLGIYGTYIARNGWYVDTILKYQWMTNDFDVIDTAGTLVRGHDVDTGGIGASVEIGKRIHVGDGKENKQGWYVEPQVQLSCQRQDGGYFNASNGLRIGVEPFTSILGRVGMLVGYETEKANLYAKVSKVKEFDGDLTIRANGVPVSESFGDNWWVYGIGCASRISDRHNLYFEIERASGGSFSQPWRVFAGWRMEL